MGRQEERKRTKNVNVLNQRLSMFAPPFTMPLAHDSETFFFLFLS